MVMAYTSGKMETDTKESGSFVLSMVKEQICLRMVILTSVNTSTESRVVKDNTSGKIRRSMLENSKKE
jgi:hypothetical protein